MNKRFWTLIMIPFLLFYAIPAGAVEKEDRKWQDESIYFLMVDRFNNGDLKNDFQVDVKDQMAYHGGDFQGVIDKLDYIKDMGFTAVWLGAIFDNEENGYHGKWVQDYYKTEEQFGTIEEFKELVKQAHNRNLKVLIDFELNHVGPNHQWLSESDRQDWFSGQQADLPVLNQENPEVRGYLIDAAKWWIDETNIDGYYLDNISVAEESFMKEFSEAVKEQKENFYLLGSDETNDSEAIAHYQTIGVDGLLDYPLAESTRPIFKKVDHSLSELITYKKEQMTKYKDPYLMASMLDNDQMVRFTHDAVTNNQHPGPRWKLALTYLYTTPGIPVVFYGTEIALEGAGGEKSHGQMDFRTDKELIEYITKLGELRSAYPSLTRGTLELLGEDKEIVVYKREYEGETSVIAINNSSESKNITIKNELLEENKELRGLISDDLVKSSDEGYVLFLDREEAEVYVLADQSGINIPFVIATIIVYGAFITFIFLLWRRAKKKRANEK
ncbi:alpha-amylase [Cytobacillus eiseniae]|uniref:alpha-amylase n=1 Tax=Cytobacillus eiseniae TaxID=762947 RepID=A0ABS4RH07_9BACI|nr:alpha-amylase family glycosyl hydrolase [Cytobacillus eiseniae]MBP2241127.1 alpha-amylase [Cytobacillus eiseniae]